ncbi:unnamed protein product, partial [Effrenium voratum]
SAPMERRVLSHITPVRLRAKVVHGFGRGSKQLGFPTANLQIRWDAELGTLSEEERAVRTFAESHRTGIYCALGSIEEMPGVHKVAMSMGWNPTFDDVKAKTIEPWILHRFDQDFYGCHLRLLVLAYVRPELKFESTDQLKREIALDGDFCRTSLDLPDFATFQLDPFLQAPPSIATSGPLKETLQTLPPPGPGVVRLFLARHGETVANEQGILCGGDLDSELNALGERQATELAEELSAVLEAPALLGSSPQRRAVSSAEALALAFPASPRLVVKDLHEMRYGDLEGARIQDVRAEMAALAQSWKRGDLEDRFPLCRNKVHQPTKAARPHSGYPAHLESKERVGSSGESPQDVARRVMASLRSVLAQASGGSVLLVCHSWVNKALIAAVTPGGLQRLLEVPQRNCALNVVDYDEGGFRVLAVDLVPTSRANL